MRPREQLVVAEEDRDLALGRLGRVRGVDEIAPDGLPVVAADRPRRGFDRIGRAVGRAAGFDGVGTLDHQRHHRRRGDVLDQPGEERLAFVLGVVAPRLFEADLHELEPEDRVAAPLVARQNLAHEAAHERVAFGENQGPFDCHSGGAIRAGR
jgi:hypothetical protein